MHVQPAAAVHPSNILVVDDDPDFSELLVRSLRRIPHSVVTLAQNVTEAVTELSHQHFDLIVSDWMLDKGNAPEVFAQADALLADELPKQPILFMSSADRLSAMHRLTPYEHFEPVSFILKRFGPPLITLLAENALGESEDNGEPKQYGAFTADRAEN